MFKTPILTKKKKCDRCFQQMGNHHTRREAHHLVCLDINHVTSSSAEEDGDDMFIDASVCSEEEGVTTVEQEDVHAWMETLAERDTLSPEHIMKYMDWGPKPISKKEEDVAEFLSTVTSGVGMSKAKIEKLLRLWNKRKGEDSLPLKEETCWEVIEAAHARMAAPIERRSVTVPKQCKRFCLSVWNR